MIVIRDHKSREAALRAVLESPMDPPTEVTLQPYKQSRSLRQSRLYWQWMTIIGKETGHDKEEVHDFCRQRFLPKRFVKIDGEVREVRPRS